jgi:integrase
MPLKKPPHVPKLRTHKATGQGYVVLNGRAVYLGRADQPDTERRYHQVIAEWLAAGQQPKVQPTDMTVKELLARYWLHAREYYRDASGKPTTQLHVLRSALKPLRELYAESRAAEFGPLALKAARQRMIDLGWSRTTVNQSVSRIKQVFRWAVENELVPGGVYHAVQAVAGLRRGRCAAHEPRPVGPVPQAMIDSLIPFVPKPVWAMIQLQLLTAARAGEIVALRPCDLDMSGSVWLCQPAEHKTAHQGHTRTIYIGPQAQEVLRPFLKRAVGACLFSPAEALAERREQRHKQRKAPLSCGNRPGSSQVDNPAWRPGDAYTVAAYRRAIAYACDRAFPPPAPLARLPKETLAAWKARLTAKQKAELVAWRREHRWHPHQLRHNAATELRREFGVETARVVLGHRSAAVTEVYAELDQAKAVEAALRVG